MSSLVDKIGAEVRPGLVQIVALSLLRQRLYGYQIVKILAAAGLETEEGTLYPLLRRLESQGLLRSEWDTAGARPRKYYELSDTGRAALPKLQVLPVGRKFRMAWSLSSPGWRGVPRSWR